MLTTIEHGINTALMIGVALLIDAALMVNAALLISVILAVTRTTQGRPDRLVAAAGPRHGAGAGYDEQGSVPLPASVGSLRIDPAAVADGEVAR